MESVVVAEDHQLIVEGYRLLIDNIDELEIVAIAHNGEEAIEAITKHRPDYLILDLHMPKLNGLDALRFVAENYPEIKVIVVSMFGDSSMHRQVVSLGARAYILKNADREEFLFALRSVMKGKSYYSAEIFQEKPVIDALSDTTPLIPLVSLTPREEEVLTLIARGYTNKEVAQKLFVSPKTIDNHRTNLMKKINVHNVTSLVKYALSNGYKIYNQM